MAKKIYKYKLGLQGDVYLPQDYEILSVQLQDNEPTMWAVVDEQAKRNQQVTYWVIPTGGEVTDDQLPWYATTLVDAYGLVLHVFVRPGEEYKEKGR